MWKEILVVLVISCAVATASKDECRHDSQCGSDECCYYHEGPLMVDGVKNTKKQGEYCNNFSKVNGHCDCGAGLKCTYIADPTMPPMTPSGVMTAEHKRMVLFGGHTECQPIPST